MDERNAMVGRTRPPDARVRAGEAVCLVAILLLAVAFRCYRLGGESLWHDETASIQYMDAGSLGAFLQAERPGDPAGVPLYFVFEYFCWRTLPNPIIGCRLLSIAFGLVSVLLVYGLGRRMFGPVAGLTAAGCAAVAIQQVYYSQEIRFYALYLVTGTLSVYSLHKLLRRGHPAWWLVHALANSALVWTHLQGVWLVALEGGVLFIARWRESRTDVLWWASIHVPIVLSVLVWVATIDPAMIDQRLNWIPMITSKAAKEFIADSGLSATEHASATSGGERWDKALRLPTVAKVLIAVGWVALVFWGSLSTLRRSRRSRAEDDAGGGRDAAVDLLLALSWLIVPAAMLLAMSFLWRSSFLPRYILHSTAALYILVGAGVAALPGKRWQRLVACAMVGLYAYDTYAFGLPHRPDMANAIAIVNAQPLAEGEKVFAHPSGYRGPAAYYGHFAEGVVEGVGKSENLVGKAQALADEGKGCWLLVGSLMGPVPDLSAPLKEHGLAYEYRFIPGAFPIRVYHVGPKEGPTRPTASPSSGV